MRSLFLLPCFMAMGLATAQTPTRIVENARPFATSIGALRSAGLLVGYPQGLHGPMTRYECAVAGVQALGFLRGCVGLALPGLSMPSPSLVPPTKEMVRWFPVVEGLIRDLEPEMAYFGLSKKEISAILDETAAAFSARGAAVERSQGLRFSDVPAGHWADAAVHSLKRLGLLKGYPDGTFRGG